MSDRSGPAHAAAAGRRGRRPALGAGALALLATVLAAAPGVAPADEILLRSGELIEGTIIDATRNTVVVRRAIGGMRQMPIRDIEEIRVDLMQGDRISGPILSWAEGVHRVRSGGEVVSIRDGRILSRTPYREPQRQPPPARSPQGEAEPAVEAAAPPVPAAASPEDPARESPAAEAPAAAPTAAERPADERPAVESPADERIAEAPAADRPGGEGAPPEETAADEPAASEETERAAARSPAAETTAEEGVAEENLAAAEAGDGNGLVAIRASADLDEAGATSGVVFKIELSRPAERTVVLIYGTVDGTAKAGEDYEPRQGVLRLAPGTRSADVRVPLIEPRRAEGDSRFELFLTADPKIATVVDQPITATIPGDG